MSLYRRLLGADFEQLPPVLRALHAGSAPAMARGEAVVEHGRGLLARLIARAAGFPPPGHHALAVTFTPFAAGEQWTRRYGDHVMVTRLSAHRGLLVEHFGPLRFAFTLDVTVDGLEQQGDGWWCCGVPMPRWLGPRTRAREWQDGERFCLDVTIALPMLGVMVAYRGWLVAGARPPERDNRHRVPKQGRVSPEAFQATSRPKN